MDIALRFAFYIVRKTSLILVVVFFAGLTFFATRDIANIYVVVNEGLEMRTSAILYQNIDNDFLSRFFSESFLHEDELLNNNIYEEYNIYDYRLRIRTRLFWVWPWNNRAVVFVDEVVSDIVGEPKSVEEGLISPPAWESGRKEIILKREQGRWQINSMKIIEPIELSEES